MVKHCSCGHVIGIEDTCDPLLFYDQGDWNMPVTHCPSCQMLLEAGDLVYSEEQRQCLAQVYTFLLNRRAARLAREKKALELNGTEIPAEE